MLGTNKTLEEEREKALHEKEDMKRQLEELEVYFQKFLFRVWGINVCIWKLRPVFPGTSKIVITGSSTNLSLHPIKKDL